MHRLGLTALLQHLPAFLQLTFTNSHIPHIPLPAQRLLQFNQGPSTLACEHPILIPPSTRGLQQTQRHTAPSTALSDVENGQQILTIRRQQCHQLRDLVDSTTLATRLRQRRHNKAKRLGGEGEAPVQELQAPWRVSATEISKWASTDCRRYEQPWIKDKRMKKSRYNNLIVYIFMVIGCGVAGYICFTATQSVPKHEVRTYMLPRRPRLTYNSTA